MSSIQMEKNKMVAKIKKKLNIGHEQDVQYLNVWYSDPHCCFHCKIKNENYWPLY